MSQTAPSVQSSIALPLGLCNPLWPAYGLFMGASLQWWALSRLARFAAPVWAFDPKHSPTPESPRVAPETIADTALEVTGETTSNVASSEIVAAPDVEPALEADDASASIFVPALPQPPVADTAIARALVPLDTVADDFTRLDGVGPKLAEAFKARGVNRFSQLAAWSDAELDAFDAELKLLGRARRFDFIGQAKALASQA